MMLMYKFCLILMLQISFIYSYKDGVYLKREKRKSNEETSIDATVHSLSNKGSDSGAKLNPFYASGEGSAEGSGSHSGSGVEWSASKEKQVSRKEEIAAGESESGDEQSGDIDASLAELLQSTEKRSADEDDWSSEEDEPIKKKISMWQTEHDVDIGNGFNVERKQDGHNEIEVKRRDVGSKARMSLLMEFFKLMESDELKVTKRDAKEIDLEDEFDNEQMGFQDGTEMNAGIMKKWRSLDDNEYGSKRSDVTINDKELSIRKREVDDIGDETVPNLSYIQEEKDNDKLMKLNKDVELDVEKRNVVDGDNAVRFLEEVNTENLFTKQEIEMLEKITRGRRNDNLETSFGNSHGVVQTLNERKREFPIIKMATSPRPKRESDESLEMLDQRPTKVTTDMERAKSHETGQSEESPIVTKRGLIHSNLNTINEIRKEFINQKESIESVFRKINKEKMEKRNVIYDDEMDADNFMANIGRPAVPLKEKRHLQNENLAMDYRAKMVQKNVMMDNVDGLAPLHNEYLDNLMKKRDTEENNKDLDQKTNVKIRVGNSEHRSDSYERSIEYNERLEMNNDKSKVIKTRSEATNSKTKTAKKERGKHNLNVDLPIGTYNKPTQVSGYWSGLGSKPIFVQKNFAEKSEDVTSGSGSEPLKIKSLESSSILRKKKIQLKKDIKPEEVGDIMNSDSKQRLKRKKHISEVGRKGEDKGRKKRMDKEEEMEDKKNKNTEIDSSKAIVSFDELHEVVSKKRNKNRHEEVTKLKKEKLGKRISKGEKYHDNDDEESGDDDEESGEEEKKKEIRSYEDDDSVVRTLSAKYHQNDIIDKAMKIIVKRAPFDTGYIGCYIDVLHPVRDLAVRAGIPFVTVNNCRSACKRTGYYYAGLQFGYLCFCGNSYGKYDMAPDSECNYACSGDTNQTCGGLWRNSIYFTAGAPVNSNEGPVPFYLPPKQHGVEIDIRRSEIPMPPVISNSTQSATNNTYNDSSFGSNTSQIAQQQQKEQQQQPLHVVYQETQRNVSIATNATENTHVTQNTSQIQNAEPKQPENVKRKVLMHFAYLHSQERHEIAPTMPPAPTPPLRIEPQTRVFKGEIKLKQKWFDEYKDKMSTKSLILAGNVEQALKNVYVNSSDQKDFLKAEVLSLREGLSKNNMNSITRVIAEFALTFDQNVISPDARLFSSVHTTKKLDEMPVFPKSLKVSEYRFDPNSPNQPFKVPVKEPINDAPSASNEGDDERRKSNIAQLSTNFPMAENLTSFERNPVNSDRMQELQNYLKSEQSLPPFGNQQTGILGVEQQKQSHMVTGGSIDGETKTRTNEELSKRSSIPLAKTKQQRLPYILRLFFWKDMLARRKRQSGIEKMNKSLLRGRRGDIENERTMNDEKAYKTKDDKIKRRFDNKQVPLTEESSYERRFMGKVKRKTKDLAAEKELKRSKRLDTFDDFE